VAVVRDLELLFEQAVVEPDRTDGEGVGAIDVVADDDSQMIRVLAEFVARDRKLVTSGVPVDAPELQLPAVDEHVARGRLK
jgi:hypothetical protein